MSEQQDVDQPDVANDLTGEALPLSGNQPPPAETPADEAEQTKSVEMGALLFFVTLLFIVPIITVVSGWGPVMEQLKEEDAARGLITFVISLGVINIAIILTLAALMGRGTPEASAKFARGKEVLTILVGILGTIVGFYFGQATATESPEASTMKTANASPEPGTPPQDAD